jgi:hypothetical protein
MVVSAKMTHQKRARWVFAVAAVQQNVRHVSDAMWTYLYMLYRQPDMSGCKTQKKRRSAKKQSDQVGVGVGGEKDSSRR